MGVFRRIGTIGTAGVVATTLALANAVSISTASAQAPSAAAADARGLIVDLKLLPTNTEVRSAVARATQDVPPGAAAPDEDQVLDVGPIPANGSIVDHIGVLSTFAGANDTPLSLGISQAVDVALLKQGETPLITADLVTGQANANCSDAPNGVGTEFVNLKINGSSVSNPSPNTVIDLGSTKVILNEQRPTFDGRGIVVNAIHVISATAGDPLFRGDVVVGHAHASVHCTDGTGTTGESNSVKVATSTSSETVAPGELVTYTVQVANDSSATCLVNKLSQHVAAGLEFVSTSGDFGTSATTVTKPGGGSHEFVVHDDSDLAAGATATQEFVFRAPPDAAPGFRFGRADLLCSNLGWFASGIGATAEVAPPGGEPRCDGRTADQVGTSGSDRIQGTAGDDVIFAGGGDDMIVGGGGNDRICAGAGGDEVAAEGGEDRVFGQGGGDALLGGTGADLLKGGEQDDHLGGGPGSDRERGESGDDQVGGGPGRDFVGGGRGHDSLGAGAGDDRAFGRGGRDHAVGGAGNDLLVGGRSGDLLGGGAGANTCRGGGGRDVGSRCGRSTGIP